jgi:hypothetical protein
MKRLHADLQKTWWALVVMTRERDHWRDLWKGGVQPLPTTLTNCLKGDDFDHDQK